MPVIVVGADTPLGLPIVSALLAPGREVRVFLTDEDLAARFRQMGVKVAIGDVSDDSHIEGAATNCFTAILVTEAARDSRERSFATTESAVLEGWTRAVATIPRVIWVHDGPVPEVESPQVATVKPSDPDVVEKVVGLDEAAEI